MHITDILSPGGRGTELSRTVARLREQEMAFRITHDDLAGLDQIARVSSRIGDASRWTELAVYHRPGENRPYLAVTEGHSVVPGEKLRFQYAAMGTLDRAMNWFEGSVLRDELAAAIDRIEKERVAKEHDVIRRMTKGLQKIKQNDELLFSTVSVSGGLIPPGPTAIDNLPPPALYSSPARAVLDAIGQANPDDFKKAIANLSPLAESYRLGSPAGIWGDGSPRYAKSGTIATIELTTFTAALAWLYPGDDLSERARALAFERDFGMPERTVRNTLAIEAGRVDGKVGPWVQPMLVALRFMDRKAWEASRV